MRTRARASRASAFRGRHGDGADEHEIAFARDNGFEEPLLMIGRLKGHLIAKQPPWLVIDVGGVGYELEAPLSTVFDLPETGREVTLFTHYAVREDTVALYGFLRESERALFRALQKVSGIGAKTALAVLSGVATDEFARL